MPQDPDDPDAHGLPPGVELPDRRLFGAGQLWALTVFNGLGLAVIIAAWLIADQYETVLAGCAAVVAAFFVINLARWWRFRSG